MKSPALPLVFLLALSYVSAEPEEFDEDRPQLAPALTPAVLDSMESLPAGLTALPPTPKTNPKLVSLGRTLFFDMALSRNRDRSCASCHDPAHAWADGRKVSVGTRGQEMRRNSPPTLNVAHLKPLMWDGRFETLQKQAFGPLLSDKEMGFGTRNELVSRLQENPIYVARFQELFQRPITPEDLGTALAEFQKTLTTPGAAFDRYVEGNKAALSDSQKRGLGLFLGKAACSQCHSGPLFTDGKFHVLGMHKDTVDRSDRGRAAISKLAVDRDAFRTAPLRNVARTAPYFHDGSLETLRDVVEFYNQGGGQASRRSESIFPLELTESEVSDLVAFLRSLNGRLPRSRLEAATAGKKRPSIRELMRDRFHEDFTVLSFTIWHEEDFEEEQQERATDAVKALIDSASLLPASARPELTIAERVPFAKHTKALKRELVTLRKAIQSGEYEPVANAMKSMTRACAACHEEFAPHVAWPPDD